MDDDDEDGVEVVDVGVVEDDEDGVEVDDDDAVDEDDGVVVVVLAL